MSDLKLVNVTKRFGDVTAVNNLNLHIRQGECFSFLGPSGCGKTTTLRIVAGFEDLDKGEVLVGDKAVSSSYRHYYLPPEKRDFAMVFQAFAVWPHLSVFENVALPLRYRRIPQSEVNDRTARALAHTSLTGFERSFPGQLSGGQQQRIALARAIALNPAVMLLDEPLSNLDPKLREEMRFEIKDLQRKLGFTIIFVTHDQSEAMALSDRMLVMSDGVVQQIDTPLNIYNNPENKFVFSFIGLSNFIPVEIADGRAYVEGAREAGEISASADAASDAHGAAALSSSGKPLTAACRPSDIDFAPDGTVAGIIKRKVYLGDIIDYRVTVGQTEIRVQKQRRNAGLAEGKPCRLRFNRLLWYER